MLAEGANKKRCCKEKSALSKQFQLPDLYFASKQTRNVFPSSLPIECSFRRTIIEKKSNQTFLMEEAALILFCHH